MRARVVDREVPGVRDVAQPLQILHSTGGQRVGKTARHVGRGNGEAQRASIDQRDPGDLGAVAQRQVGRLDRSREQSLG